MMNTNPNTDTASRQDYEYDYDAFINLDPAQVDLTLKYPMAANVLFEDNSLTKPMWAYYVVSTLLRIRANQTLYNMAINKQMFAAFDFIFDIRLLTFVRDPDSADAIGWIYKLLLFVLKLTSKATRKIPVGKGDESNEVSLPTAIIEKGVVAKIKSIQEQEQRHQQAPSLLSFKNYQDIFQVIYLPDIASHVKEDKAFAAQRIAGVNPLVIARLEAILDKFPVTNAQYQTVMGTSDSLETALAENRLYITDYQDLQDIVPGTIDLDHNTIQKYIYQPIALFAVESGDCPRRRLVPVAIQCYQEPSPENPIFVAPTSDSSTSERWAWQMAKTTVQIADSNYHEFISHLGGTHLWMEPIVLATYRKLSLAHPLGALLIPHFEGTLFINDSAIKGLINPGGTVDKVAGGTLKSSLKLSLKGAKGYPFAFNQASLPNTLKSRGVDDPSCLPDYPYRDDALLIWNAIHEWVANYLQLFYPNDLAVRSDREIQEWIDDLTDPNGGQMTGIGETNDEIPLPHIQTVAYLIEAVTTIIFTASVQHAAVNFPQSSLMTYMPNMPLAGYRPAPQTTRGITEADYFELLPPLSQSETQMNMTYVLGSIYYTQLGHYGDRYFTDSRVAKLLDNFQERLQEIELEIEARNEIRITHYDVLLPSKIPQSINI
jgi:arachidonate 15-lipoxygenase